MNEKTVKLALISLIVACVGILVTTQLSMLISLRAVVSHQKYSLALQRSINKKFEAILKADMSDEEGDVDDQHVAQLVNKVDQLTALVKSFQQPTQPKRQGPPPEDYSKVHTINVEHSPVRGAKDAPITIVEFVDFQCPFCARFHPVLNEVLKAYPKQVNYMLKNFPLGFHPEAKPAAKAAYAAGEQGKYWEMTELLLTKGRELKALSTENFESLAKELKLNVKKFLKDYTANSAKYDKWIEADMAIASKIDVRGTPTFYLGGKKTRARDLAAFKREIDAILKK